MKRVENKKYKFSWGSDADLTILLPPNIAPLIERFDYNIIVDLTLHSGLYQSKKSKRRIVEKNWCGQRKYLLDTINDILCRETFGSSDFEEAFTIFEIQEKTNNIHCHSSIKVSNVNSISTTLGYIKRYLKKMGFKQYCVEYIKYPEQRRDYVLKKQTKLPFYVYRSMVTTDILSAGEPEQEPCEDAEASRTIETNNFYDPFEG